MLLKKPGFYVLAALMIIGLAGCNVTAREPVRYYDRGSGFSIKLPGDWKKITSLPGAAVTVQNPGRTVALSIAVQKVPANSDPGELIKMVISHAQARGITYKDRGQMSLDGRDAYWMVGDAGVQGFVYLAYFILKGDRWYSLQFVTDSATFTESQYQFADIADTFKLE
jgi:hypothetical protein